LIAVARCHDTTISTALAWAHRTLAEVRVDSPSLDAALLLAHVLGWDRAQLYAHGEWTLPPEAQACWTELIARRARHEPLAYLLGYREFYGLTFRVDRRVLIPRPETEDLVEQAMAEGQRILEHTGRLAIADVGTGCGAIAIVLARHLPSAEIYGMDISRPALEVAVHNGRRHGVEARIHWLRGDLLTPLLRRVDLIVANLPYVSSAEATALPPEVSDYEPRLAWDGGADGVETIGRLLTQAGDGLNAGGQILLEIGAAQGSRVQQTALRCFPGAEVRVRQDGAGLDRLVRVFPAGTGRGQETP